MTSRQQLSPIKISVATVLIVAAFVSFDFFFLDHASAIDTSSNATSSVLSDQETAIIDRLDSLTLDTDYFRDPVYLYLKSNTVIITPEIPGKPNPFAPIAGVPSVTTTTNTTTKTPANTTSKTTTSTTPSTKTTTIQTKKST